MKQPKDLNQMVSVESAFDKEQFEFTVAICTLNRRLLLERAAREVLAQLDAFPNGQLLIVDNGSADGTADYVSSLARNDPRVRLFVERRTGQYYARAAAIEQARGSALIFLDDDAVPQEGWLNALLRGLHSSSTVGVVGCGIDPAWETERPSWLSERLMREIPVISPPYERVESRFPCYPPGIALAMRLNGCAELYAAQPRRTEYPLGRKGTVSDGARYQLLAGDDTDLCEIYARNGFRVIWSAAARVSHAVASERMQPSWYLRKFKSEGHLRIRLLRLGGYSVISRHSWKMLAALPVFALARPLSRFLPQSPAVLVHAYYFKCVGAWSELLWGPRLEPLPYVVDDSLQGRSPS
jgi:glycosyltransferase involved in cell wall biosynthesis